MARHEIDAFLGLALLVAIEQRAADQAVGKRVDRAVTHVSTARQRRVVQLL
jgi:hypothetical protein